MARCAQMSLVNFNWKRSVFRNIALIICFINANAELLIKLQDLVVMVGDLVTFTCRSNVSAEIHWEHDDHFVYAGGKFYKPYNESFRMDANLTSGTYSLILWKAETWAAGVYKCTDNVGKGLSSSANLTVLDSSLKCLSNMKADGFVGPNTCNLLPDVMTFNCSVSFSGKHPPSLTWISANESFSSSVCINQQNTITCSLTLNPKPVFHQSVFICKTSSPTVKQYNCSSEFIKVQYSLKSDSKPTEAKVNDEISCWAKSKQPLHFNWTYSHDNHETTIGNDQTHLIKKAGMYWCNVSYSIRNVSCFSVGPIVYAKDDDYACVDNTACKAFLVLLIIFGIIIIILIGYFFVNKRKTKRKNKNKREENVALMERSETIAYLKQPTFLFDIETKASQEKKSPIYGLAILGDELFTISRLCKEFEVYEYTGSRVNEPKQRRPVDSLKDPRNIVACNVNRCLYIENMVEEKKLNEIIRLEPDGKVVKRWRILKDIGRISVTSKGNVLVTVRSDNTLHEYTSDGKLIRRIKIEKSAAIRNLRHALLLPSGHFVVCHGDEKEDIHRVCIIDSSGKKAVSAFGDETTDPKRKLSDPQYLATDSDGSILVADDDRVVLLNPQLHFKRELLKDEEKMKCTYRVCIDRENGRLLVTDNNPKGQGKASGKVLVYRIFDPEANQSV